MTSANLPEISLSFAEAGEPLLNRVPKVDAAGALLGDLMVILPGLRSESPSRISAVTEDIRVVLTHFSSVIVFAELNVSRNLLWLSVRPVKGIRATITNAIREKVPAAKLISHL